jgi:hypothetical protein
MLKRTSPKYVGPLLTFFFSESGYVSQAAVLHETKELGVL